MLRCHPQVYGPSRNWQPEEKSTEHSVGRRKVILIRLIGRHLCVHSIVLFKVCVGFYSSRTP